MSGPDVGFVYAWRAGRDVVVRWSPRDTGLPDDVELKLEALVDDARTLGTPLVVEDGPAYSRPVLRSRPRPRRGA